MRCGSWIFEYFSQTCRGKLIYNIYIYIYIYCRHEIGSPSASSDRGSFIGILRLNFSVYVLSLNKKKKKNARTLFPRDEILLKRGLIFSSESDFFLEHFPRGFSIPHGLIRMNANRWRDGSVADEFAVNKHITVIIELNCRQPSTTRNKAGT